MRLSLLKEPTRTPEVADLAYLAGYFDGEGCVYTRLSHKNIPGSSPTLSIQVKTGDPNSVALFQEVFGGSFYKDDKPKAKGLRRQIYTWYANGKRAQDVLGQLLPFLHSKVPAAEAAMKFNFRQGSNLSPEEKQNRRELAEQIRAFNQRVTLAAWA